MIFSKGLFGNKDLLSSSIYQKCPEPTARLQMKAVTMASIAIIQGMKMKTKQK